MFAGMLPLVSPLAVPAKKKWPVGCRDLHLKIAGLPDSWSCMKALGAEGTEANVELDLTCAHLFHPQEQELESARGLVKAAQQLGVDIIRIDVVPRKLDGDKFLPFAIDACKRLCAIAEGTPIRFGVENHGKITNNPQFLEKLFDGVGSPKLGLTLDCANFYWWGHPVNDLYPIYEKFAPRVVHTHCKSIRYPADKKNVRREIGWEYGKYNCPIYEGDLDFKRIVKILRQAGYRGDLCIENESLGKYPANEQANVLRKEIAMLKGLV